MTHDIDLRTLKGKRFRIGNAYFSYQRPRPPCLYMQKLTEPGMVKALAYSGGISIHCFNDGEIKEKDTIEIFDLSVRKVLVRRFKGLFSSS